MLPKQDIVSESSVDSLKDVYDQKVQENYQQNLALLNDTKYIYSGDMEALWLKSRRDILDIKKSQIANRVFRDSYFFDRYDHTTIVSLPQGKLNFRLQGKLYNLYEFQYLDDIYFLPIFSVKFYDLLEAIEDREVILAGDQVHRTLHKRYTVPGISHLYNYYISPQGLEDKYTWQEEESNPDELKKAKKAFIRKHLTLPELDQEISSFAYSEHVASLDGSFESLYQSIRLADVGAKVNKQRYYLKEAYGTRRYLGNDPQLTAPIAVELNPYELKLKEKDTKANESIYLSLFDQGLYTLSNKLNIFYDLFFKHELSQKDRENLAQGFEVLNAIKAPNFSSDFLPFASKVQEFKYPQVYTILQGEKPREEKEALTPQAKLEYVYYISQTYDSSLQHKLFETKYNYQAYHHYPALFGLDDSFNYDFSLLKYNIHIFENYNLDFEDLVDLKAYDLNLYEQITEEQEVYSDFRSGKLVETSQISHLGFSEKQMDKMRYQHIVEHLHAMQKQRKYHNAPLRATILDDYENEFAELWLESECKDQLTFAELPKIEVPLYRAIKAKNSKVAQLKEEKTIPVRSAYITEYYNPFFLLPEDIDEYLSNEYKFIPYDIINYPEEDLEFYIKKD
ncbi:hypothetical protein CJP74_02300 [Psittacicella melopsittaci]|uniref:Uncharacterized protein n=1 Tax=Psittacicella melopsittaci TaxID=2028576 RepID=A0A3A1Y7T7_9GAMM|nr:hypothetical protein [Psittacicella melopsittaci]RIY33278.1 hypothetical protein CJP74_02300 [Psittacicella melopsittaci]